MERLQSCCTSPTAGAGFRRCTLVTNGYILFRTIRSLGLALIAAHFQRNRNRACLAFDLASSANNVSCSQATEQGTFAFPSYCHSFIPSLQNCLPPTHHLMCLGSHYMLLFILNTIC